MFGWGCLVLSRLEKDNLLQLSDCVRNLLSVHRSVATRVVPVNQIVSSSHKGMKVLLYSIENR